MQPSSVSIGPRDHAGVISDQNPNDKACRLPPIRREVGDSDPDPEQYDGLTAGDVYPSSIVTRLNPARDEVAEIGLCTCLAAAAIEQVQRVIDAHSAALRDTPEEGIKVARRRAFTREQDVHALLVRTAANAAKRADLRLFAGLRHGDDSTAMLRSVDGVANLVRAWLETGEADARSMCEWCGGRTHERESDTRPGQACRGCTHCDTIPEGTHPVELPPVQIGGDL